MQVGAKYIQANKKGFTNYYVSVDTKRYIEKKIVALVRYQYLLLLLVLAFSNHVLLIRELFFFFFENVACSVLSVAK
jgi:hypothetical protein